MINFDIIINKNNKIHNLNWPQTPDYPNRILIIGGSGSGKTICLLNLTNQHYHQPISVRLKLEIITKWKLVNAHIVCVKKIIFYFPSCDRYKFEAYIHINPL